MPFMRERKLKKKRLHKEHLPVCWQTQQLNLGKTTCFWYKALNPESDRVNKDERPWLPGTLLMQKGLFFLQIDRNS